MQGLSFVKIHGGCQGWFNSNIQKYINCSSCKFLSQTYCRISGNVGYFRVRERHSDSSTCRCNLTNSMKFPRIDSWAHCEYQRTLYLESQFSSGVPVISCPRRYSIFKMAKIVEVSVRDIRFPTSLELHGSDAMVGFLPDMCLHAASFFAFLKSLLIRFTWLPCAK